MIRRFALWAICAAALAACSSGPGNGWAGSGGAGGSETGGSGPGGSGPGGIKYNGHTYLLTSTAEGWDAAQAEAASSGGYLAAVNDQAEQDFLTTTFCKSDPLWIGASNPVSTTSSSDLSATYSWTSGEPFSYTAWSSGEPNNWTGDEHYVAMNWHFAEGNGPKGLWNDAPLDGTQGYGGTSDGPYFGIIEIP